MILLLLGTDEYRKRLRRVQAIEEFGVVKDEVILLDPENASIQSLNDNLLTFGLFSTTKVIVLTDVGKLTKNITSHLTELLSKISDDVLLILEATTLDKRTEFAKTLLKLAKVENFDQLEGITLERWVSEQARSIGVTIEPLAARALIEAVGSNSWRLKSELIKLSTAALNEPQPRISVSLVQSLVTPNINANVFALTDALIAGRLDRARLALVKLASVGEAPIQTLGFLTHHLRTICLVKDAYETNFPAKLHPFVVKKNTPLARTVSWPVISNWYSTLSEYDWQIKTGKINADVALELIVHELID